MEWWKSIDLSSKQCLAHMKEQKVTIQGQETKCSQIRTILKMTVVNR